MSSTAIAKGFYKFPHLLFDHPLIRQLNGEAFRTYLFLASRAWRFAESTGRLRASVSYICTGVGTPQATVSRVLRSLQDIRLIRIIVVDYKRGSTWEVVNPALLEVTGPPSDPKPMLGSEQPQIELPQNEEAKSPLMSDQNRRETSSIGSGSQPNVTCEKVGFQPDINPQPKLEGSASRQGGSHLKSPTRFEEMVEDSLERNHAAGLRIKAYLAAVTPEGKKERRFSAMVNSPVHSETMIF